MSRQSRRISTSGGFAFSLALVVAAMEYVRNAPFLSPENAVLVGVSIMLLAVGWAIVSALPGLRWVWRNVLDPNRV